MASSRERERFDEDLHIRPLRDGKVASTFSFTTLLQDASPRDPLSLAYDDESQHYTLFPLALGQILRTYAITELHLALNAGKWRYESWGFPEEPGVGTGAELWAWMGDGASTTIDERWQGLRNALAGLFCASLGSMDDQRTTSPFLTFTPEGSLPNATLPYRLRHATLPSEHVCTENLTPFLKLLPCKSLSGLARLLNPHRLFDADWHGMSVHVTWREGQGVEVRLIFQTVIDPIRNSGGKRRDWSFESLFGRVVENRCPVATTSRVRIQLPSEETYAILPDPTSNADNIATYDTSVGQDPLDVSMRWPEEYAFQYQITALDLPEIPLTPLTLQRTLIGSSQAQGQLSIVIQNTLSSQIQTIYLETMPWLVQLYIHTLQIHCNGVQRNDLISNLSYTPSVPHARPAILQSVLTLPPKSTLRLTFDITKSFLRYTEHPPDAQRGWDLPPAVFVPIISVGNRSDVLPRLYTPTLLVDLATPDFSMPYNVIILSCTLMTLIFGSIFNLLTRKFVIVDLKQGKEQKGS
ncbi:hypothetical protein SERLA73DRAFT_56706 [Serpula lacrymans var. lacrymans S7.3]|uniref:Gpi16 subunit, GPI transamidase component n=2 Tax=Serpula lacrymans var. lacrymans TaxID=341189 RepID=F8Q3K4_SERL3|nr:uncharacterized protein SERLADRAFT_409299 [Serpula lacrymans var. lacrymans S7.9]EGN97089.1 hypothetical protein SERLA73DRAFT_56706 [Serpula lacrymans var. lacrymans S7.3]EGO22695.1 hypothetical protein SERLADRAFT_409299 [Serpula lacrymans var. lacrymans S7.9]